jgi:hypothetical protein
LCFEKNNMIWSALLKDFFQRLEFGPLPPDLVNGILGCELEPVGGVAITPDAIGRAQDCLVRSGARRQGAIAQREGLSQNRSPQKTLGPAFQQGLRQKALAGMPTSGSLHPFRLLYQDLHLGV